MSRDRETGNPLVADAACGAGLSGAQRARIRQKKNGEREHVAKTIIIKNFPEELHRKAKAKAALEGITLKALIIKLLETYLEEFRT